MTIGDLSRKGKTCSDADHIGFADTALNGTIGESLKKRLHAGGTDQIGVQNDDILTSSGEFHQGAAIGVPHECFGVLESGF